MPSQAGVVGHDDQSQAIKTVLASLEDSKAENIVSIDIRGKSSLGDHMVIASGRSNRHVAAVADHLISALKDAGLGFPRVEGLSAAAPLPRHWLDAQTMALGNAVLVLGPDPVIGPQAVLLRRRGDDTTPPLRIATDGLRPFAVMQAAP